MPRIKKNYGTYAIGDLGSHIAGRIKASGKTQAEVAEEMGVTQQTVSRWLRRTGTVTIEQVQRLAQIVPLDADVVVRAIFPWGVTNA